LICVAETTVAASPAGTVGGVASLVVTVKVALATALSVIPVLNARDFTVALLVSVKGAL
jgi:hypothetical protein